mmetsp:Transcript_7580/g.21224  ORF Transcript_7580/g.21224 Transcript_7580/m.21224 type:complete len:238 (-) Transcript_7580:1472-2185(-)
MSVIVTSPLHVSAATHVEPTQHLPLEGQYWPSTEQSSAQESAASWISTRAPFSTRDQTWDTSKGTAMPPSRSACRASSTLRRLSEFASNARNAAEMPEKASFLESIRACRGHCTSKRRKPSDTAGVVVAQVSCSQFVPVLLRAHSHLSPLVMPLCSTSQRLWSQTSSTHITLSNWKVCFDEPVPHHGLETAIVGMPSQPVAWCVAQKVYPDSSEPIWSHWLSLTSKELVVEKPLTYA